MPESPLLSIVITAYKSRDEIGPCLRSLPRVMPDSSGKTKPVEVIVVDNSSDRSMGEMIRNDYAWVKYIDPGFNLGFGRANNIGYAKALGEYILFLNPDTICNDEALFHCIDRLYRDKAIGLISPRLMLPDGSMDLACRRSIPSLWDGFCRAVGLAAKFPTQKYFAGYNLTYLDANGAYDVGAINGAFMMAPRLVLERVGIFDERFFMYGDDLDLCIRVARAGWRIVYDGGVQIIHLKGVSVAKDYDVMSKAIFDANCKVYLKHFNPEDSRIIRWKYQLAFGAWKILALCRGKWRGYRRVRPI